MPTVSGVSSNNGAQAANPYAGNQALGRDAFLNLLTTQLRNQDPMNPMDNTEFVSQMAQFSSLEQLQNMNESIEAMLKSQYGFSALNLIGRNVTALNPNGDEPIRGKVDSITFEDGLPMVKIGSEKLPLSYVMNVSL